MVYDVGFVSIVTPKKFVFGEDHRPWVDYTKHIISIQASPVYPIPFQCVAQLYTLYMHPLEHFLFFFFILLCVCQNLVTLRLKKIVFKCTCLGCNI